MKTLEQYLKENADKGIIDHSIRSYDGKTFYIHPDSRDGDTLDFEVDGNNLRQNPAVIRTDEMDCTKRPEDVPEKCPKTGLPFFMMIEHPVLGVVPTYGGPFDSYTIPEKDEVGEYTYYKYDHDEGCWEDYCYSADFDA